MSLTNSLNNILTLYPFARVWLNAITILVVIKFGGFSTNDVFNTISGFKFGG